MTFPVCPCDDAALPTPGNLPAQSYITYRIGDYASFRQAVLTPLFTPALPMPIPVEQTLSVDGIPVWTASGAGDLTVMIAEWFAYIADIIAFYNERIANQDYLRTANLPESVTNLIALLGYRPRPAIGASGLLAALLSPGPSFGNTPILLPPGLQFQSKPTPGLTPQIFELTAATPLGTPITAPDQIPATPTPRLLDSEASLLLQGTATMLAPGAAILLTALDSTAGGPWLGTVTSLASVQPATGGQQTRLAIGWATQPPVSLTASTAQLTVPRQSAALWSFYGAAFAIQPGSVSTIVELASLVRQINPGDYLIFTSAAGTPAPTLAQVSATQDQLLDANVTSPGSGPPFSSVTSKSGSTTTTTVPLPIPQTQLTLNTALTNWSDATGVAIHFGFVSAGTLLNQPPASWSGGTGLTATTAQNFPTWNSAKPILLQDATGIGLATSGTSAGNTSLGLGALPIPVPQLQPPFLVLPNLLAVTRGKTVAKEILGSGNANIPGQTFQLSQSPVTYLPQGAGYVSTIDLTVNNLPWQEVKFFYGQKPDATIFTAAQDAAGNTHITFGDGINGARLPTGTNNIIATYRTGAGAAAPPAGKLSIIAKSFPGLRAVLNPVAVSGGGDADRPDQIQHDAPRSVLAFGRAVSVFDYAALADEVAGVTRSRAVWGWSDARQRSMVTLYVGDDANAANAARTALAGIGDPNRPIIVLPATQIRVALGYTLLIIPGADPGIITSAIAAALTDPQTGLFCAWKRDIGQVVFNSQIEAAILGIPGTVAITELYFWAGDFYQPGALHNPGEGGFYTLDPADIYPTTEPDPNG